MKCKVNTLGLAVVAILTFKASGLSIPGAPSIPGLPTPGDRFRGQTLAVLI